MPSTNHTSQTGVFHNGHTLHLEAGVPKDNPPARDRVDALVTEKGGKSLRQALSDTYGPDADSDGILSGLKAAFDGAEFRFDVLMDTVDDRLKALIEYVNANSKFSFYGVGLDIYQDAELDILIPTLFGAEVRKTTSQSSPRGHWDADRFLDDARQRLAAGEFAAVKALHAFAVAHADRATYGSGQQTGSINFKPDVVSSRSLFTLWTDGKLQLNFRRLSRSKSELNWRTKFGQALEAASIALPPDYLGRFPVLQTTDWVPMLESFISAVKRVLQDAGEPTRN